MELTNPSYPVEVAESAAKLYSVLKRFLRLPRSYLDFIRVLQRNKQSILPLPLEINAPETDILHKRIIASNPLLRSVYDFWYKQIQCAVRTVEHLSLPIVELGCGPSHLEKFIPDVIKTDVVAHENVTQTINAEGNLPFPDCSVGAFVLVNVLHHLRTPESFLVEAERCLARGGRLVMIEPSNSPIHKFIINKCHPYEYHDDSTNEWTNNVTGRLTNANNAIPWIIFRRDRHRFVARFPTLKILRIQNHTLLNLYLSGGFSYRPFVPPVFFPLVRFLELLCYPISLWLGSAMTVVIEKK